MGRESRLKRERKGEKAKARERQREIENIIIAVEEMAPIIAGGLGLAASFYAYFFITSMYFPSKGCIMTPLLYLLFILPMFHFIHFIAYLHRFFTKGDCQCLNEIVTKATGYILFALCVYQACVFIFPSGSGQPPLWFEPSNIISPAAVTGCLKNSDVCQNLAKYSPDSYFTFHHPIVHACCVHRRNDVWDLAVNDHDDQLNGSEIGHVAKRCMAVYVENIGKTSELAGRASIPFEGIVLLIIIFLMPMKRATRAVIAS